jgi:uncharacterized protein YndB with AHSA1/START domain
MDATAEKIINLSRTYAASLDAVFDAWLDPVGLVAWFLPGPSMKATAEIDARVGGAFQIIMKTEENEYVHDGKYLEIDRPNHLVFTWISPGTQGEVSKVTVNLTETGDGTRLDLTHEGLPSVEAIKNHTLGWGGILEKLGGFLAA